MSKEINNRAYRQQVLKELISQLHGRRGWRTSRSALPACLAACRRRRSPRRSRRWSTRAFRSPRSSAALRRARGGRFMGSIEEIHAQPDPSEIPGHPASTPEGGNRAVEAPIGRDSRAGSSRLPRRRRVAAEGLSHLKQIDRHYQKKENLLPYMERYGITAPPKVMWGVDDEIRLPRRPSARWMRGRCAAQKAAEALFVKITEMIFKEESILAADVARKPDPGGMEADRRRVRGDRLLPDRPAARLGPAAGGARQAPQAQAASGEIRLPTGSLKLDELVGCSTPRPSTSPLSAATIRSATFRKGRSASSRTKAIIGREVSNCHPPASVHIVEALVEDFKAGRKDHEDFWIKMGDKYILIRYFAVRSEGGEYLGVLEVTQNIGPIQAISGEKRLVSQ